MSYQVLARKYRPRSFGELEGQEHVLRALVNALEQNRLHHAYLFTGTRGVGKTTIARILAKCLNCESGVTASPCGECSSCREIAEGRSVDLIEVDAASRTRVEDTRELLDNVQYMPTRSRFKVYLIDEVHMLSTHSFNALLKTLEEPPEHVKFLLATTDPRKLPVTVLSRCLQFNLKNLSPERVVSYLKTILEKEGVEYEEPALWQLGRAADGSMRDALSLTDQAISFGNNRVGDEDVRAMLGSIDQREVYGLLDALIGKDAKALLGRVAAMAEFGPDYEMLLDELLSVLHRVAVAQAVEEATDNSQGDRELLEAVGAALTREEVQLYYQIGLIGSRDLPLAPDPREGFEMIMLRMLAFAPVDSTVPQEPPSGGGGGDADKGSGGTRGGDAKSPVSEILSKIGKQEAVKQASATVGTPSAAEPGPLSPEPAPAEPGTSRPAGTSPITSEPATSPPAPTEAARSEPAKPRPAPSEPVRSEPATSGAARSDDAEPVSSAHGVVNEAPKLVPKADFAPGEWAEVLGQLTLAGVTRTLAANCVVASMGPDGCVLRLGQGHASLWNDVHEKRIGDALSTWLGRPIALRIEVGEIDGETPAMIDERQREEARSRAIAAIENDENVRQLIDTFDGKLNMDSIVPRQYAGE